MPLSRRLMIAGPLACLALREGHADPAPAGAGWPGGEWERTTPEREGWAAEPLGEARAYAESIGTASLVIVQRGRIVSSLGDIARRLELHSVRKSLLSALIGIAVAERRIDLGATLDRLAIDDVEPALTSAEKQATVRMLLQARSGIYHPALYETAGMARRRPLRGSHPPGTFWYYNNWDFNALGSIYEGAAGMPIFDALAQRIAAPLGMQDFRPQDGRYVRGGDSLHPAYPLHMSARDLARFGLLYLRNGFWHDRPVIPAGWVRESTLAASETYLGSGYGYLWWTGYPDRRVTIMDLPPGAFWADGHKGQFVIVDPADDLVVVHQTTSATVTQRQMGHLMWLIQKAARVADPGNDPGDR